jgi:uncharacterized protein
MSRSAGTDPLSVLLDGLPEGETAVAASLPPVALDLAHGEYTFPAPVQVELSIRRSVETFLVAGTARTSAAGECCRCLAPTSVPLEAQLSVLFQRKEATADELEAVAEEDEVEIISPGTRELDLHELVREALVLELPVRVYCRPDCRGLCSQCGKDLNQGPCACQQEHADPRWQALKDVHFN